AANVAKMRAGVPLTDEDRAPWLRAITDWMDTRIAAGQSGGITCSALKRAYRDQLLSGRPAATMIFLQVSRDVLITGLDSRPGPFSPKRPLDSQLAAGEPPEPDERVHTLLAEGEPEQTVAAIIGLLWPDGEPAPVGPPTPGSL